MSIVKELKFGDAARSKMVKGVNELADAVAATMGPMGRNVVIEQPMGAPTITKDGVSVAKAINLEDKFENMGVQMVKQVAAKTNEAAGDGTTTATVLARALINQGMKGIASGIAPIEIKRGFDLAVTDAIEMITDELTNEIDDDDELLNVATISANSDPVIGKLIVDAMTKVGRNGVITVEEGNGVSDELDIVDGMQFDRGMASPLFVNTKEDRSASYEKPFIALINYRIETANDLMGILETSHEKKVPLVVIADDITTDALNTLVVNHVQGRLRVVFVKTPGFGDQRRQNLEDIAVLTGGKVFSVGVAPASKSEVEEWLGRAEKVRITNENTTIVDGLGEDQAILDHVETLETLVKTAGSEADFIRTRIARLSGGIAVIRVGGATELEMKEKKDRIDDALNAARAASEEGIVPGGGTALAHVSSYLANTQAQNERLKGVSNGVMFGYNAALEAFTAPARQIAENAGYSGELVIERLREMTEHDYNSGFNAATGVYENMLLAGVIDPARVTKQALTNASSVAGLMLTTQAMISIKPTGNPADIMDGFSMMG